MDQEPIETVEYQVPTTVLPNANKIIELTAVNELSEVVATIAETDDLPPEPMDMCICGTCQTSFATMELFLDHKTEGCEPSENPGPITADKLATIDTSQLSEDSTLIIVQPDDPSGQPQIVMATHAAKRLNSDKNSMNLSMTTEDEIPNASWNKTATIILITVYKEYEHMLRLNAGTMTKKDLWIKASKRLADQGFQYSADQCFGRWKTLVNAYRKVMEHNSHPENNRRMFPYEQELAGYAERAGMRPINKGKAKDEWSPPVPNNAASMCNVEQDRSVDEPYSSEEERTCAYWGRAATLILIEVYQTYQPLFKMNVHMTKKHLWIKLSKVLRQRGYDYNTEQCAGRWKTLVSMYKRVKEHNSIPENEMKFCSYHKELAELYGDECPDIVNNAASIMSDINGDEQEDEDSRPTSVAENKGDNQSDDGKSSLPDEGKSSLPDDFTPAPKKRGRKRKYFNISKPKSQYSPILPDIPAKRETGQGSEMVQLMTKFMSRQESREKEEIERRQKMHDEKMQLLSGFLEAVKSLTK